MRLTRPSWSAYALIMGRCWTGYTSISGGMLGMTHSYRTHGRLAAAWGHLFSSGYGLCEAKMPSEKIRWIRSLRGAECEERAVMALIIRDAPSVLGCLPLGEDICLNATSTTEKIMQ